VANVADRILRKALRALDRRISRHPDELLKEPFDPVDVRKFEEALRELPMPTEGARLYLQKHVGRLARTLALVPPPASTGRALELGCYMQITPFLQQICGYKEVRGGYFGKLGKTDHKVLDLPRGRFECFVDLFDAERDRYPYPDGHFDLVIAGEIIEHMVLDPMHLLLESRRVLRDGGTLIVTTPNVGSLLSVAKVLEGKDNPQIFFLYGRPDASGCSETGHMREYTLSELGEIVKAAGFEVDKLFTTFIEEFAHHRPIATLLREHGYETENRGEQSWCAARKNAQAAVDRYPWFVYTE